MNEELVKVEEYLAANKLSLNTGKTIHMLFGGRRTFQNLPNLYIYGNIIERKESTKFLGIFIDQKISWKSHADFIIGKLSRILGILGKINDLLTLSALKNLYLSLFQPSIQYGLIFWYSVSSELKNKIFRKQKIAIRLMNRSSRYSSTHSLFLKSKILKLEDLYRLEACKFIQQEICFSNHFSLTPNYLVHGYPTRSNLNIHSRLYRTQIGSRFILSNGVKLYNELDDSTKEIDSVHKFKCKLKLDILYDYNSPID